MKLTTDNLKEHLISSKLHPHVQPETNQLYYTHKSNAGEYVIFLRIYEDDDKLQIMTFLPPQVLEDRFEVVGRILHHFNKEIDLPGFGLDEKMGLTYHRIMMLAPEGNLEETHLECYLNAIPLLCDHFLPAISLAASSPLTYNELTQRVKK